MKESFFVKKAKLLIASVKGTALTLEERKDKAIALAALLLEEARRIETGKEKKQQLALASMLNDPAAKTLTTLITDQCFRSRRPKRIASQIAFVIKTLGIPKSFSPLKKMGLFALAHLGNSLSSLLIPLTIRLIRNETRTVILPGELGPLSKHLKKRKKEGVRVNLNHLGEAILGEDEAQRRLDTYLQDLANDDVECISIKISTLYSQINLLSWENTLSRLKEKLRQLYRAAIKHPYKGKNDNLISKFVNMDMEEYRDLSLTAALFKSVLDEEEFFNYQAGIVLQSYLPDSFLIQQKLTSWAMQRLAKGGAPIKIRLVKGANLAMEKVESALHLWPQAPYLTKVEVDANFKRMLGFGTKKNHAEAAHVGVGSHNLFDIAYALLLRSENETENEIGFEMLEGMADPMRRSVQQISQDMLLYCPAATQNEFQNAVAYLVRRLDENTAPENFLSHAFDLHPKSQVFEAQAHFFTQSCLLSEKLSSPPRRTQNRLNESYSLSKSSFSNEPDTDWSLAQNREWAKKILDDWKMKIHPVIPVVVGGINLLSPDKLEIGIDPSFPKKTLYRFSLASQEQAKIAIESAKKEEEVWSKTSIFKRMELLKEIGNALRKHRSDLIGAMVADTGKTVFEADIEVSEAIDFAEYYRFNIQEWHDLSDIEWKAKGTVLVASPWNFPCSIPAGGILAALASGNCVIFKPAPESILVGWHLAQIFWNAGVSKKVLQFTPCQDDPVGSLMVKDPRISAIILTGATATAKLFLKMRPDMELMAETGGKNAMVITALADRDLAIKDMIQSAFGYSGQKCSACSLAIIEAEVYDDPQFFKQLTDAVKSLIVGSPWNLETKITPLIRPPNPTLLHGLTKLEKGEGWLLEPKQSNDNPHLWSPGIKIGAKPMNFTYQNELFGPVLSLVRADTFEEALNLMNETPYGLTAGIHSLDVREQAAWLDKIVAGNCYINRTITGAIVERQPFGGTKESSFGKGAKAGGPNYLVQFMKGEQIELLGEMAPVNQEVGALSQIVKNIPSFAKMLEIWQASIESYAFFWQYYFSKPHDPMQVLGQDNLQCYKPHPLIFLRWQKDDSPLDIFRSVAATLTCRGKIEISTDFEIDSSLVKALQIAHIPIKQETEEAFIGRIDKENIKRVRLLSKPSFKLSQALAEAACNVNTGIPLANGRLELLHCLREISISCDYHRYGYVGIKESKITI